MNTMKRLALAALAVAMLLPLAALPAARAETGTDSAAQATIDAQRQHMLEMRTIMHYAAFVAQPTEQGVTVQVTSPDATLAATIREEFGKRLAPNSPVEGSALTVAEVEGGVALAFTSGDAAVVKELQAYGPGLGYALLRNDMHATMLGLQGAGGYGPGMMGPGWQGYGPGYGPGRGMMGGGMMGRQGYGPQGYGPGRGMMGGYGPGYGRGMMGGYGPGWMHGGQWPAQESPVDNGN